MCHLRWWRFLIILAIVASVNEGFYCTINKKKRKSKKFLKRIRVNQLSYPQCESLLTLCLLINDIIYLMDIIGKSWLQKLKLLWKQVISGTLCLFVSHFKTLTRLVRSCILLAKLCTNISIFLKISGMFKLYQLYNHYSKYFLVIVWNFDRFSPTKSK